MAKLGLREVGYGLLLLLALLIGWGVWSDHKAAKQVPALKAEIATEQKISRVNDTVLVKREETRAEAQKDKVTQDAAIDKALQQSKAWADSPVPDDVVDALSM